MKKITLLLTFLPLFIFAQNPFITTWQTNADGSGSSVITIPTNPEYNYNYDIDWESDGIYDDIGVTGDITHDYGTAGTYTVAIRGVFPSIRMVSSSPENQQKLTSLDQWGDISWSTMQGAFYACFNLEINATDVPDLTNVTDMGQAFQAISAINSNINSWDVSNVNTFRVLFADITSFNQDISNWDMSSAININNLFQNCTSFNQDISNWNVENVNSMISVFVGASSFNQNISNWDVGSVTDMRFMFFDASSFNQNLGNWDVSNVEFMNQMFENVSLSTENYNALLEGWSQQALQPNIVFGGGNSQYCTSAKQDIIDNFGWTITDGGAEAGCAQSYQDYAALVAFYNATNGDNWTNNANWLSNEPISTWYGVTLDANDRVISLQLFDNGLTGTLPPETGDLNALQIIELTFNNVSGNIPSELGNLSNLLSLQLEINNFTGLIPEEIGNLSNLQSLDLQGNNFTGDIPSSVFNISNLEELLLLNNNLSGELPPNIGNSAQNLEALFLSGNNLEGTIPSSIGNFSNLWFLAIDNNNFSGPFPDLSQTAIVSNPLSYVAIELNDFIFSDLELQFDFLQNNLNTFNYAPMNPFTEPETIPIVLGQDIILDAEFNNGTSGRLASAALNVYQWYKDGVLINGATDSSYTIVSATNVDAGTYICSVTNTDVPGLTLETSPYIVESSLGIDDADRQSFKLYPNPTKDKLTIASNNNTTIDTVEFYDILGKRILTISRNFESIDVSKLALGTYFVKIKAGSSCVSKKLVVK